MLLETKSVTEDGQQADSPDAEESKVHEGETGIAEQDSVKQRDEFLARFDDGDPENPLNWSAGRKIWMVIQISIIAFVASFGSAVTAAAQPSIERYTGVSANTVVLTISLYTLGFVFGPCVWGPTSEIWGRRWSLIPAMVGLGFLSLGTALSRDFASIAITRFVAGFFGSGPVANVSAALGDIYEPRTRGIAMSMYGVVVVGGPLLAPIIGAAIVENKHLGWRWTCYLLAILSFADALLTFLCFPEIYAPVLLGRKAKRLRRETGDASYHHPHEDVKVDFKSIFTRHFARPVRMLLTEPFVTAIATYASFVFANLYLTLQVFPIVYRERRRWGPIVSTLPFIAMLVGVIAALGINLSNQPRYARAVAKAGGKPVPEARLLPIAIGGVLFAVGLFVFAGTAPPHVPWPPSVIAAAFIGAGFTTVFQNCLNYLVDFYRIYAASAVSANTLLRSIFATALPLAARPMIDSLGISGAMGLLGGLAALALPMPFVLMRYGAALRKASKFAPESEV